MCLLKYQWDGNALLDAHTFLATGCGQNYNLLALHLCSVDTVMCFGGKREKRGESKYPSMKCALYISYPSYHN